MSQKIETEDGKEIEVYTAEEVAASSKKASEDAVAAAALEFGKTKTQIEAERDDARKALGERSSEFAQFRKLNTDQVAKLSEQDRIIYENGLALEAERLKGAERDKKEHDARVESAIRAKSGTDEKLHTKIKEMFGVIGIEANTPEEIERKVQLTLGAISTTEPDLLAGVIGFTGSFKPPVKETPEGISFADTDKGKGFAKELGLNLEAKK